MQTFDIRHDAAKNQFIIEQDGAKGFLEYQLAGKQMAIMHTIVAPELEGQGVGAALAKHTLDFARTIGYKVVVHCGFVITWLKRHKEYEDMVVG